MRLKWVDFKSIVDALNLDMIYVQKGTDYIISINDPRYNYTCTLSMDNAVDFEGNYKSNSNIIKKPVYQVIPFSKKLTEDGRKIYRRKHGVSNSINANSTGTIEIIIPYNNCKIDQVEIAGCEVGDSVDLKVYDTPTGTISGVSSKMLNQFGFSIYMRNDFYKDKSDYDVDLIKDMKVEVSYNNNGASSKNISVNFTLHEVTWKSMLL